MSRWLLSRPLIHVVFFVERWVFSALFLFLAYEYLDTLRFMALVSQSREFIPPSMVARDAGFLDGVHFEDYVRYGLLAALNAISGVLLLISHRPKRFPNRAAEIIVPLLATFFYLVFNQRVPLPSWMTTPWVPAAWGGPLAGAGLAVAAFGLLFTGYAVSWLGRSMGIMVSLREVVLGGPFRYVRHPIYLGYFFVLGGLFLTACTFRMGVLTAGAAGLLVWRARLEEFLISTHSPAYREWMRRTAFFWPHFRPRAADAPEAGLGLGPPELLLPAASLPR